jgi:hypothetical protein
MVPELEHSSGSWVATRKSTGEVIGEFYVRDNVEKFNPATVLVETILQYLVRIRATIKA